MKPVIKAFLVAPILPFLIYGPMAVVVVVMGWVAYAAALVFGIPLYLFLRHHPRWQTDYIYALCGGLIGILVAYLLIFKTRETDYYGLLFGLYHGMASGYIFWKMTRPKIISSTPKKNDLPNAKTY